MRHKWLLHYVTRVIAIMVLLIALAVGGSMGGQALVHRVNTDVAEKEANRAHFYRVVAGEEEGGQTVDSLLARDLRDADLDSFRGHSNTYGGITDAIGEDPFVSEGCQECGALTPEFRERVESVQQGNLDQVLATDIKQVDTSGYTVTPFGMSVPTTLGLLWFFGGPLALALGHRKGMADHQGDYDVRQFADLDWKLDGNPSKLTLMMLAPGVFVPYGIWRALTRRRFQQKVAECYASEMQLVREIDRDLERLRRHRDDPKVKQLKDDRDFLVSEIESLTRADTSVDDLLANSTDRLDYIKASLRGRKEFLAELEPNISTNVMPELKERR